LRLYRIVHGKYFRVARVSDLAFRNESCASAGGARHDRPLGACSARQPRFGSKSARAKDTRAISVAASRQRLPRIRKSPVIHHVRLAGLRRRHPRHHPALGAASHAGESRNGSGQGQASNPPADRSHGRRARASTRRPLLRAPAARTSSAERPFRITRPHDRFASGGLRRPVSPDRPAHVPPSATGSSSQSTRRPTTSSVVSRRFFAARSRTATPPSSSSAR
jgi:hypothetical protein